MAFDAPIQELGVLATSVFRPGQDDVPLADQKARAPVAFSYKDVTKATGIKGLRYKDEATLMAVMAVYNLLENLGDEAQAIKDRTAVIVSSNFGNVDTVVNVAKEIAATSVDDTSAMALPNASSNSVSATLSILFQLRGINLMLCNGEQGGEDGFALGQQLIGSRRADRFLLVGVEVDNDIVQSLFPSVQPRFHGAAAVLVGPQSAGQALVPTTEVAHIGRGTIEAHCGLASGADGVLRLALAKENAEAGAFASVELAGQTWKLVG